MVFPKRLGLVIWIRDLRKAKHLERVGNIHFISKRMRYVFLYINENDLERTLSYLKRLDFVERVERSYRGEILNTFHKKELVDES